MGEITAGGGCATWLGDDREPAGEVLNIAAVCGGGGGGALVLCGCGEAGGGVGGVRVAAPSGDPRAHSAELLSAVPEMAVLPGADRGAGAAMGRERSHLLFRPGNGSDAGEAGRVAQELSTAGAGG